MLESSKVLVKEYNKGHLKDIANYPLSYWTGYTIVEIDDDEVFGFTYHSKSDGTLDRTFFRVKLRSHNNEELGMYFNVKGTRVFLRNFMRI